MAALNLTPDFTLIAGQAVLFSVNLFVVSKLWVQPYLGLRQKQRVFTVDVKTHAEALFRECRAQLLAIEQQLEQEREKLRCEAERYRQMQLQQEKEQFAASRQEASAKIEQFRFELRSHLEAEKKKIPQFVSELSQRCLTAVLQG